MDLKKLNPWNWFKHEESDHQPSTLPIRRSESSPSTSQQPAGGLWQLHREMDRLFDEAFRGFGLPTRPGSSLTSSQPTAFVPRLNVASTEQGYSITLEAPGLSREDIKLDLQDRTLFIRGEKRQEKEEKDQHFYRIERHYGQFQRVLELPADVELEKISASMKNGVLTLTLPRQTGVTNNGQRSISITDQDT